MILKKCFLLLVFLILSVITCREKIPEGPERSEILEVKLMTKSYRLQYAQENNWDNRFKIPAKKMSMEEYENLSTWHVPFIVTVHNDFDEAMEGKKWIDVKINIWPANEKENWTCQLTYNDTNSNRYFTIPPGDSLSIYTGNKLIWEQKDSNGKSIHATESFVPIWIECTEFDSLMKGNKPPEIVPWRYCDTTMLGAVDTVISYLESKKIFAQAEVQLFKNYHVVKSNVLEFDIYYFFPADGFKKKFWCIEGLRIAGDPPCPLGNP